MGGAIHQLAGKRFGLLTVLDRHEARNNVRYWLCRCDCGNEKFIATASLMKGATTACGCRQFGGWHRTHGMTHTRIFRIWKGMKTRCTNPNATGYHNYGGRGVKVCPEWMASFEAFYADMAATYQDHLTIERKNYDLGYEPGNCIWITKSEQGRNSRKLVIIDTPKGPMHLSEAARAFEISLSSLWRRVNRGWPAERLFDPPGTRL